MDATYAPEPSLKDWLPSWLQKHKATIAAFINVVMILAFLLANSKPVLANPTWNVQVGAHAKCLVSGDEVGIEASFANNDTRPIAVVATDMQTRKSVDLGTIESGGHTSQIIHTGLLTISSGQVRFDMRWADGSSGSDTRYDSYDAATCLVMTLTPTSVPNTPTSFPPSPTPTVDLPTPTWTVPPTEGQPTNTPTVYNSPTPELTTPAFTDTPVPSETPEKTPTVMASPTPVPTTSVPPTETLPPPVTETPPPSTETPPPTVPPTEPPQPPKYICDFADYQIVGNTLTIFGALDRKIADKEVRVIGETGIFARSQTDLDGKFSVQVQAPWPSGLVKVFIGGRTSNDCKFTLPSPPPPTEVTPPVEEQPPAVQPAAIEQPLIAEPKAAVGSQEKDVIAESGDYIKIGEIYLSLHQSCAIDRHGALVLPGTGVALCNGHFRTHRTQGGYWIKMKAGMPVVVHLNGQTTFWILSPGVRFGYDSTLKPILGFDIGSCFSTADKQWGGIEVFNLIPLDPASQDPNV